MDTKVEQNGGSIPMEPKRDFKSGQDEGKTSEASKVPVAILGSGDYSRSLAGRLVRSGFAVVVGSRDPDRNRRLFPQGAEVTTRQAALSGARLVFVAVHRENYPDLQQDRDALAGKILIDVSNNTKLKKDGESNAEYLARLLPGSTVVKGFNVVSAWSLESGLFGGSKEVFISSDDAEARRTVMQLAQDMRFAAVDYGSLRAAREIEAMPLRLLPSWHLALKMVLCVLTFYVLWNVYRGVVFYAVKSGDNYAAHIPIHQVNRALGDTAITTLCLVYTPGVLASFAQLYNGTKYKRFPNWLDKWMRARKQLGLLCLFIASIHACLSVLEWSPAYGYDRLFEKTTVNANGDVVYGMMRWSGETFLLFGTLALFLMAVLGVASIPSVGSSMNWREFNFVQSKLGWTVFLFAVTHCSVYVAEMFIESYLFTSYTPPAFYIDLTLCAVLLLLKIVTLLPCVSSRVDRIRRGWERKAPKAGKTNAAYSKEDPEMTSYL
ncbi:PREDICTED: metalloreductase STEAP3-like [Branchiostoma belcheri]|uniref:Metalloreductase STEAP3-like n=1 Tax=Branchiostoma belcheri TaxID=7741 RepID=A0A6P5ANQ1_BRABE|nr:PREDICTED: metalloreductase STEAP3-like [Branchiostoma belcheri]